MTEIRLVVRVKIHPGKFDDLEQLIDACVQRVRERDTGTLLYDFFLSDDWSECVVHEHYRDSQAVLEHLQHVGDILPKILETGEMAVEVYGLSSAELKAVLEDESTRFYPLYRSLHS
ncbi:MAG: antibiotic biosynthesis monooxygenase [Chthoniobacteraceae bacterium]